MSGKTASAERERSLSTPYIWPCMGWVRPCSSQSRSIEVASTSNPYFSAIVITEPKSLRASAAPSSSK